MFVSIFPLGVIEEIFCSVLLEESLLENEMSITDLAQTNLRSVDVIRQP